MTRTHATPAVICDLRGIQMHMNVDHDASFSDMIPTLRYNA